MQFWFALLTCCALVQTLFAGRTSLCGALSLIMRTANTYLGSLMWVDFVRLVGLQPKRGSNDKAKK